jgi:hypothetical protein
MRDLKSRLRAVVQQDVGGRRSSVGDGPDLTRHLTYVPDVGLAGLDLDATASALGGVRFESRGTACIVLERRLAPEDWHGRRCMAAHAVDAAAPIHLFDPRVVDRNWASRLVFFDIETTGLSGGAGTIAFLACCGWFEDDGFTVRQFFLSGPGGEHAMLDGLSKIFDSASLLVTFNGRSFDVPIMETRWAFHRRETPTADLPHFDMLPPARRLWGRRDDETAAMQMDEGAASAACTLNALERCVLRFHRIGDVSGFEIPSRYFYFLRTGDTSAMEGVLEHNRFDVISLAAVMSHALRLAADGPDACETAGEQLGLGGLYEGAGDRVRAMHAYRLAADSGQSQVATHAASRLALLLRRERRFAESADAWRQVLTKASRLALPLDALERRATEALAIHHEHRDRDLATARRYAESLRARSDGRLATKADHRLGRLTRKIKAAETDVEGNQRLFPG